jgi:hypothetical protein
MLFSNYFCGKPSYFKTRLMDFILGHAPTTHIGMRGFCTGRGGGKNLVSLIV